MTVEVQQAGDDVIVVIGNTRNSIEVHRAKSTKVSCAAANAFAAQLGQIAGHDVSQHGGKRLRLDESYSEDDFEAGVEAVMDYVATDYSAAMTELLDDEDLANKIHEAVGHAQIREMNTYLLRFHEKARESWVNR